MSSRLFTIHIIYNLRPWSNSINSKLSPLHVQAPWTLLLLDIAEIHTNQGNLPNLNLKTDELARSCLPCILYTICNRCLPQSTANSRHSVSKHPENAQSRSPRFTWIRLICLICIPKPLNELDDVRRTYTMQSVTIVYPNQQQTLAIPCPST